MFPQPWPRFTELLVFTHTCRGAFPSESRENGPLAGEAIFLAGGGGAANVCTRGHLVTLGEPANKHSCKRRPARAGGKTAGASPRSGLRGGPPHWPGHVHSAPGVSGQMSEFSEPCRPPRMWRRAGLASKPAWLRREKGLGLGQ